MDLTKDGISLIQTCEGCELKAYKDIAGVWTIGFGQTGTGIVEGLVWTQDQADAVLNRTLAELCVGLKKLITFDLTDNEFSAVVSLTYNIGIHAFSSSTMLKLINDGALQDASDEFVKWDHAGGREVAGLYRRRMAERRMFNS